MGCLLRAGIAVTFALSGTIGMASDAMASDSVQRGKDSAVVALAKGDPERELPGVPVRGSITLADGKTPVPDGLIYIYDASGDADIAQVVKRKPQLSVTDKAGQIKDGLRLSRGSYLVKVSLSSEPIVFEKLVIDNEKTPVTLTLKAASASMSGVVLDVEGKPANGAAVILYDQARMLSYRANTNDKGRYEIPSVVPGKFDVAVVTLDPARPQRALEKGLVVGEAAIVRDFSLESFKPKK